MYKEKFKIGVAIIILGVSNSAAAYNTDGYLNDWLVSSSSFTAISGLGVNVSENGIRYGAGGQAYDAERLMADVDWNTKTLNVAVITGTNPTSGGTDYPADGSQGGWRPGDLAIYTGSQFSNPMLWDVNSSAGLVWETNSYPSGSSVDSARNPDVYGLRIPDIRDDADTNNGDTGNSYVTRDVQQNAWWFTQWGSEDGNSWIRRPTSIDESDARDGDTTGTAKVVYTEAKFSPTENFTPDSDIHYLIEMAIPLDALGWTGGDTFDVALSWTMNCANDWINGFGSFANSNPGTPPGNQVPEPTSLALLAVGLIGVGYGRKRFAIKG